MCTQITSRLFSYRARILIGEYDMAEPHANTQVIGLKASTGERALAAAGAVTGRPVLEAWRQDGTGAPILNGDEFIRIPWLDVEAFLSEGLVTEAQPA